MTTQTYPVRVEEHGDRPHAYCPYCSMMYALEDATRQPVDLPAKCKRCSCPMDESKLAAFSDEVAKSRGVRQPPRTTQMREPTVAKGR